MSLGILPLATGASQLEELIKKYMEIESKPVTDLKAVKEALNTKAAMFRDLNSSLLALKNAAAGLIPDDLTSLYDARAAVSANPDVVSAKASALAARATYRVFVERLAGYDVVVSNSYVSTGTEISMTAGTGTKTFTVTVGGASWDISVQVVAGEDNATVLANIAAAINASGAGAVVSATVVSEQSGTCRLVITARSTGSASAIILTEAGGEHNILSASGTSSSVQSSGSSGGYLVARDTLDAKFTLNGLSFVRSSNEVSDAISGVTLTLKKAQTTGEAPVNVDVTRDTSSLKDKIEAFISSYNSTIGYLSSKTLVDVDAGIRGDLAGDPTYLELKLKMNRIIQGRVEGLAYPDPTRLYDLGITLDSSGNLVLSDEAKLDAALADHPEAVEDLFTSASGVAVKMRDLMEPFVEELTGIIARQQQSITNQISRIDSRVKDLEERLAVREKALRSEFSSLIRAMQLMSAQSALLSSFMAQANAVFAY
ncbi:MAG: flagellar filament capping protein FliD [Firmicutes bacterium]|nr:flagellar filament capping protein FliD [Bacillota bacterium]MDH7496360.1 flagellar filament capping protein FliD [Bacillota bacterium]